MEKAREVEVKQRQRLQNISMQRQSLIEQTNRLRLFEENNTTAASILDQEDAQRKQLVDVMVRESTPSNAPVVRVLTNIQGKRSLPILIGLSIFNTKNYLSFQEAWGN